MSFWYHPQKLPIFVIQFKMHITLIEFNVMTWIVMFYYCLSLAKNGSARICPLIPPTQINLDLLSSGAARSPAFLHQYVEIMT